MNEQLEELENQLADMPLQKRLAVYAVIFFSILYASWYFLGEDMVNETEVLQESVQSLSKKLQNNSIKSLSQAITKTKKQNLKIEDDLVTLHFKEQFLQNKLEKLNFIYFNDLGIATILENILKHSMKEQIDIHLVESIQNEVKYVAHIVDKEQIYIKGSGSFKNILSLIQQIDYYNALLQIKEIEVSIDENSSTNFDLNISHYGVEL